MGGAKTFLTHSKVCNVQRRFHMTTYIITSCGEDDANPQNPKFHTFFWLIGNLETPPIAILEMAHLLCIIVTVTVTIMLMSGMFID